MKATDGDAREKTSTVRVSSSVSELRLLRVRVDGCEYSNLSIRSRFSRQSRKSIPRSESNDLSSPTERPERPPSVMQINGAAERRGEAPNAARGPIGVMKA